MEDEIRNRSSYARPRAPSLEVFSRPYRTYVLIVLMCVLMINTVDRIIFSVLMQPIKSALGLSDTQLGLTSGIAFTMCYAALGIPIAMWADKGSRRNIIAAALALFSSMTVLSGMVTSFLQLILVRAFLAVGESGTTPSSHSMISDMFPAEQRGSALGLYTFGINLGILTGFLVGGWVSQLYGWRAGFFVVGTPGLTLAAIVRFTLKEPVRGTSDGLKLQASMPAPSIGRVLAMLWSQHSFRHLMSGVVIIAMGSISLTAWLPAFLARSYAMAPGKIGSLLALMFGIVGGAGTFLAGYLADRLGRRDIRWNVWILAISTALILPFYVGLFAVHTKTAAELFLIYPAFAVSAYLAPSVAMTQRLVISGMRAQASAIFALLMSLIGGIGPVLTGLLSDWYHAAFAQESLRYGMLTMAAVYGWAAAHFAWAGRTLQADTMRARAESLRSIG